MLLIFARTAPHTELKFQPNRLVNFTTYQFFNKGIPAAHKVAKLKAFFQKLEN